MAHLRGKVWGPSEDVSTSPSRSVDSICLLPPSLSWSRQLAEEAALVAAALPINPVVCSQTTTHLPLIQFRGKKRGPTVQQKI